METTVSSKRFCARAHDITVHRSKQRGRIQIKPSSTFSMVILLSTQTESARYMRPIVACALFFLGASSYLKPQSTPFWVGSWAASQQIPEPNNALPANDLRDATLRQIVHLSLRGRTLRVHVSNAFGTAPLHFSSVTSHTRCPTPRRRLILPPIDNSRFMAALV